MGQKVNPIVFRLGIGKEYNWAASWFAKKSEFGDSLLEDVKIRKKILADSQYISSVHIEKTNEVVIVTISSSNPGQLIGKKGDKISIMKKAISAIIKGKRDVKINIVDIKTPDINANIIAKNLAHQIENRVSYKRAINRLMQSAKMAGAVGIKISVSGRLNGAEIARTEWFKDGTIPLHTLRAKISYAIATARTIYGAIGVKVWIHTGN